MNGFLTVTYQSKLLLIANDPETGRFKCAYILRGGEHGHKHLSTEIIGKYEECNYSYMPNNLPALRANQASVGRLRALLKKTVSYMQARPEVERRQHWQVNRRSSGASEHICFARFQISFASLFSLVKETFSYVRKEAKENLYEPDSLRS